MTGDAAAEWKNACTCIVDDHCSEEFDECQAHGCQQFGETVDSCAEKNKKDPDDVDFNDIDVDGFDTCLNSYDGPSTNVQKLIQCVVPIYQECIKDNLPPRLANS